MAESQEPQSALQLDLFDKVLSAYAAVPGEMSNNDLYLRVGESAGIEPDEWDRVAPIGKDSELHKPLRRKVRWHQQTAKQLGLIERGAQRGAWRLTPKGRRKLTPATPRRVLIGFSTDLGLALWGCATDVFARIDEPITLALTSPPYCLANPRLYGNVAEAQYVDWLCGLLEPIVRSLVPGGSICLNVSNDIFLKGSPARSLYRERLVLALADRFGLSKMEEFPWINPTKCPGPIRWASLERFQLSVGWEPIYWFTNDPKLVKADNRRVLQAHTEAHLKLIRDGGENRITSYGDGANRLRKGSFGRATDGRIPKNTLTFAHRCRDQSVARSYARSNGLAEHGAAMPLKLAQFLVEYLCPKGELVVDPCAG